MREQPIIVSQYDRDQLVTLIQSARLDSRVSVENLNALARELARATAVPEGEVPADVVSMNSSVTFVDLATGEEENYTLVYPRDADLMQDKISVLAPIGTALLGYRVGDEIEWQVPAGTRRLKITRVEGLAAVAAGS